MLAVLAACYNLLTHCASCSLCLHTVHGFEFVSYTTPESDTLQGIDFHPNVKGNGTGGVLLQGTIAAREDTGSKLHNIQ